MIIFLSIILNMCFGCSKELSHWDGSLEYPQHIFWLKNKKYNFQLRTLIIHLEVSPVMRIFIFLEDFSFLTKICWNKFSGLTQYVQICCILKGYRGFLLFWPAFLFFEKILFLSLCFLTYWNHEPIYSPRYVIFPMLCCCNFMPWQRQGW